LFYRFLEAAENRRAARIGTALLAFVPYGVFFSLVYTESLFLLAFAGFMLALQDRRYLWAGLAAGAAGAVRMHGLLLVLPLIAVLWRDFRAGRRVPFRDCLAVPLAAAGVAAYALFLWVRFGSPWLMVQVQSAWNHRPFMPHLLPGTLSAEAAGFFRVWSGGNAAVLRHEAVRTLDIWWLVLGLGLIVAGFWLVRQRLYVWMALGYWVFCLLTLTSGLQSLGRYLVVLLPLYHIASLILEPVRKAVPVIIALFAAGLVWFALAYANWYWIG
jgi:hypothetical protein